jgi:hypothetical protein
MRRYGVSSGFDRAQHKYYEKRGGGDYERTKIGALCRRLRAKDSATHVRDRICQATGRRAE